MIPILVRPLVSKALVMLSLSATPRTSVFDETDNFVRPTQS